VRYKLRLKIVLLVCLIVSNVFSQVNYEEYFNGKTLRFDFYHSGNKSTEEIIFSKMKEEGDWSGSKKNLIDTLRYGNYFFELHDIASNKVIYSRGFSTLYQEWQTTEEAKQMNRIFEGSVVMPFPKIKTKIVIFRRDRNNNFISLFQHMIDPANYFIEKSITNKYPNFIVHSSGDPSEKLDIVFIPDGYSKEEMKKFKDDCSRMSGYLFDYSPFDKLKDKINIWGVEAPSDESGTDIPGKNIWVNTQLNSSFYTFDSERYLMTSSYFKVKDIAANAPYDQIYILVNTDKYGGGAIYNFYSLTCVDNKLTKQVFIHEFGHGLAGLADEYGNDNTYQDMYPTDIEPWEVNLTTLVNFESKWKNMIDTNTPIPTPSTDEYKNQVGVFEGGGYVAKGVYRPTFNSLMNSFSSNEFNEICKKALINVVNFYSE